MSDMFINTMNEFKRDLQKVNSSSPASTTSLAFDFCKFRSFVFSALSALQRQVDLLDREFDRHEMRRRRKMLLLHGLPEEKSEDTSARVNTIVADHLNFTNFLSSSIKSSYRLGRPVDNKPRPIVIKFTDSAVRDKVWFAKTKLKGTGYTQSEFLTRTRHQVFLEARQRFGIGNCWTRDGYIQIVTSDGKRHRVESLLDLKGIPSSTVQKSPTPEKTAASNSVEQKPLPAARTRRVLRNK